MKDVQCIRARLTMVWALYAVAYTHYSRSPTSQSSLLCQTMPVFWADDGPQQVLACVFAACGDKDRVQKCSAHINRHHQQLKKVVLIHCTRIDVKGLTGNCALILFEWALPSVSSPLSHVWRRCDDRCCSPKEADRLAGCTRCRWPWCQLDRGP